MHLNKGSSEQSISWWRWEKNPRWKWKREGGGWREGWLVKRVDSGESWPKICGISDDEGSFFERFTRWGGQWGWLCHRKCSIMFQLPLKPTHRPHYQSQPCRSGLWNNEGRWRGEEERLVSDCPSTLYLRGVSLSFVESTWEKGAHFIPNKSEVTNIVTV